MVSKPTSINPMTGRPYSGDFPLVTVRDSVGLHSQLLVKHLGVREVFAVVGGSMGGMQALEWTFVEEPPVHAAVALACNGKHNAWQIGFSGKHSYARVIRKMLLFCTMDSVWMPLCCDCMRKRNGDPYTRMPFVYRVSAAGYPGRPTLRERTVSRMVTLWCLHLRRTFLSCHAVVATDSSVGFL